MSNLHKIVILYPQLYNSMQFEYYPYRENKKWAYFAVLDFLTTGQFPMISNLTETSDLHFASIDAFFKMVPVGLCH